MPIASRSIGVQCSWIPSWGFLNPELLKPKTRFQYYPSTCDRPGHAEVLRIGEQVLRMMEEALSGVRTNKESEVGTGIIRIETYVRVRPSSDARLRDKTRIVSIFRARSFYTPLANCSMVARRQTL